MKITDSFYEKSRNAAVWLLRVESLILVGIVLYLLLASVFSTATWPSALIGEIVFALIGAAGLFFASMGFARKRSYGRAPAVLANAIAVGVHSELDELRAISSTGAATSSALATRAASNASCLISSVMISP